jgi:CRP/FNR family transcriptional regulator, cyclic AMP receptor protein
VRLGQFLNAWGKVRGAVLAAPTGQTGVEHGAAATLKERYLSAIDVFQDLPPAEVERLAKTATMVTCERGRTVFRAGDASDTLFLLKKGRVQIVRETADGKRLVTAVLGPETFFGEMVLVGQRFPQDSSAEALDDAVVCVMSRHDVERLIVAHPKMGLRFLERVGARLAETQAMVEDFAFKPVAARLAGVLLRLAGSEPAAGEVSHVDVSHQELADMVATYRETVTVTLHDFKARGLVELGRRSVTILDRPGLEAQADAES